LERCLPLRASDVASGSDVHCVSDVSPCGEVDKHYITLHRKCNTSLFTNTPKCAILNPERRWRYEENNKRDVYDLYKGSL